MKLVQIWLQLIAIIYNLFYPVLWKLETSSRSFFNFDKLNV